MRRDIVHYYQAPVEQVFKAYSCVVFEGLGKNPREVPYKTIQFGLNYSFRYNMNGGACTLHFMPYRGGTAVDARYSVAQLLGARYGAYNNHMIDLVVAILHIRPEQTNIPIETFLEHEQRIGAQSASAGFCPKCGNKLSVGDLFCRKCGNRID